MLQQSKNPTNTAELLRSFFEATAPAIGDDFFRALVRHLATTLEVRQAFVSELGEDKGVARTLAIWHDGKIIDNIEYSLPGTPCELVLQGGIVQIPENFRKEYPGDEGLAGLIVESYVGIPLVGHSGEILGHVVAMHDKPMIEKSRDFSTFELFAARVTAELERRKADKALEYRIDMEKLLADISTRFINISAEELDNAIENALCSIGKFANVDRSYVFLLSDDRNFFSNSHEWCAGGIERRKQNLQNVSAEDIRWLIDKLSRNEIFYIRHLSELPPEAEVLREYFRLLDVRSILEVPMLSKNQLMGFLGFHKGRSEKEWSEEDIRLLKLASEIITHALERRRAEIELEKTQAHLIQTEKMAIIGKLTAGLAHEVNNPVGAILSAVDNSGRSYKKINDMLATAREIDEIRESKSFQKALKILNQNNQVISAASRRVVNLVTSLKNFASLDQAKYKKVKINEVINDTLMLIGHGLDGKINVQKEFGNVPEILGNPGELNQVFLTVLTNAIQAISEKGTIRIHTCIDKKDLKIEISDDGKGISPEKLDKIFDFNFTTKESRVGFSMGLFSAYQIIQNHKGSLDVKSEEGKGTSVSIFLPIEQ